MSIISSSHGLITTVIVFLTEKSRALAGKAPFVCCNTCVFYVSYPQYSFLRAVCRFQVTSRRMYRCAYPGTGASAQHLGKGVHPMSTEVNKALARRIIEEAWNHGNL